MLEILDDNENIESSFEIDWEFVLFQATPHQMDKLLECFVPKEVKIDTGKEVIKSEIIQEDRPPLIIT